MRSLEGDQKLVERIQTLYTDKYPFNYKPPLEWNLKARRLEIVKRRYPRLFTVLNFLPGISGLLMAVTAYVSGNQKQSKKMNTATAFATDGLESVVIIFLLCFFWDLTTSYTSFFQYIREFCYGINLFLTHRCPKGIGILKENWKAAFTHEKDMMRKYRLPLTEKSDAAIRALNILIVFMYFFPLLIPLPYMLLNLDGFKFLRHLIAPFILTTRSFKNLGFNWLFEIGFHCLRYVLITFAFYGVVRDMIIIFHMKFFVLQFNLDCLQEGVRNAKDGKWKIGRGEYIRLKIIFSSLRQPLGQLLFFHLLIASWTVSGVLYIVLHSCNRGNEMLAIFMGILALTFVVGGVLILEVAKNFSSLSNQLFNLLGDFNFTVCSTRNRKVRKREVKALEKLCIVYGMGAFTLEIFDEDGIMDYVKSILDNLVTLLMTFGL